MTVLFAMLVDAYRQLNARKLFWITLALSGLVVVGFASLGFDEDGIVLAFGAFSFENPILTKGSEASSVFYREIFSVMTSLWLGWIATILALVSTTSLFPDFIAGGAIDLVLSKPVRRTTLFITKYVTGLLFVTLQVTVFCIGSFICLGWRLGEWDPAIFMAIPIVIAFFSYLYSVNVLLGILTRSGLAALLITLLLWCGVFSINSTELLLNQAITLEKFMSVDQTPDIEMQRSRLERLRTEDVDPEVVARAEARLAESEETQERKTEKRARKERNLDRVRRIQSVLPKTNETIGLVDRWVKKDSEISIGDIIGGNVTVEDGRLVATKSDVDRAMELLQEEYEAKSVWYVIGSSLLFELGVLVLACVVFVRRDY